MHAQATPSTRRQLDLTVVRFDNGGHYRQAQAAAMAFISRGSGPIGLDTKQGI